MKDSDINKALELIKTACELLGWGVAIPAGTEELNYLIIGTDDGLQSAIARMNGDIQ